MVKFGERQVGPGCPCFITFEAGPTHNGLESAKRLVSYSADAGADAVKFQMFDPERFVADKSIMFEYGILVDREKNHIEKIQEPLYDLFVRRSLSRKEWLSLKAHADSCGLAFFATAGFPDEIEFLADMGCQSFKIASSDVNHLPLIRQVARTGLCVQLDTGNSTIGEIEEAIQVILGEGNNNIIIHHCPSGYPARIEGVNLKIIQTLKQMFEFPVAFSDHSPGWEMDVAAVALGVDLVEKTITEDRTTRSVEHAFSIEPDQYARFVQTIQNTQRALGLPRRELTTEEAKVRQNMRRSTYLSTDATAGTLLSSLEVIFRRPGTSGISSTEWERFSDRRLRRDLPMGHQLQVGDLE